MKAILVSTTLLVSSSLPSFSLSGEMSPRPISYSNDAYDARITRLERTVAELRLIVDELRERLSYSETQPSRAQVANSLESGSPPSRSTGNYQIRSGDTLWKIARRNGVDVKDLQRCNPGLDPRKLRVGKTLVIPRQISSSSSPTSYEAQKPTIVSTSSYRIQNGDTLGHIAQRHGLRLKTLMAANPGLNPKRLHIGKQINLPQTSNLERTSSPPPLPDIPTLPPERHEPSPVVTYEPLIPDPYPVIEAESGPKLITLEKSQRLSYLAALYGTDVHTLNRLNEVELPARQLIRAGSQIYIPSR